MRSAMAAAAFAAIFAGPAWAQTNLGPPPSALEPGQTNTRPYQSRNPADRGVDLNNNSATGRTSREPRSGSMPQRLGPIAPGTGARDRGPPDSSTYNPSAPSVR